MADEYEVLAKMLRELEQATVPLFDAAEQIAIGEKDIDSLIQRLVVAVLRGCLKSQSDGDAGERASGRSMSRLIAA